MNGYSTYIMGDVSLFNRDEAGILRACAVARQRWAYMSNWRVLHIDGFEPIYARSRAQYQFTMKAQKRGQLVCNFQ